MKRVAKIALLIFTLTYCADDAQATGFYGPTVYLDQGGKNVDASPEFYWELEVKRLAREFRPAEKLVVPKKKETQADEDARAIRSQDTAEADLKDFADALQAGEIKPADPAKATHQHETTRALIAQTNGPATANCLTNSVRSFPIIIAALLLIGEARNIGMRREKHGRNCSIAPSKIDITARSGRHLCSAN